MKILKFPHCVSLFQNYSKLNPTCVTEKTEVRGEVLDLIRISRTEMGAYLCIANNSVQPAVSKRIILNVDCKLNHILSIQTWAA